MTNTDTEIIVVIETRWDGTWSTHGEYATYPAAIDAWEALDRAGVLLADRRMVRPA